MYRTYLRYVVLLLVSVALSAVGSLGLSRFTAIAAPTTAKNVANKHLANSADWPQWRGLHRDAISPAIGLLKSWPEGGPKLLWTCRELGRGFSSLAVVDNRAYTLGGDGKRAFVVAVNIDDGQKLWATELGEQYENNWGGGPRGTPTVDGDHVYALDAVGTLACLERASGQKVWMKSLVKDFGGGVPNWGYCESPLIDGDKVLATPGGKNCIVALNKRNGETIWTSTGVEEGAHYASLVRGDVDGVGFYVTQTSKGMVCVAADSGKLLWRFEKTGNGTATIPTPVVHGNYVYGTSGYGTGCGLVKLAVNGQEVQAEEVYFNKEMKNQHGGVLLLDGHIYGHSDGGGWLCQNFLTGEVVWRERSLGKGSIACADGYLYCYTEGDGTVALARATPDGYTESGRFVIPEKTQLPRGSGQIWAHPVVAQGRLFLRDQELLFCYDVAAK